MCVCVWNIQSRHKLDCIHSKACSDECMGMQLCILLNVQEEGAIIVNNGGLIIAANQIFMEREICYSYAVY